MSTVVAAVFKPQMGKPCRSFCGVIAGAGGRGRSVEQVWATDRNRSRRRKRAARQSIPTRPWPRKPSEGQGIFSMMKTAT